MQHSPIEIRIPANPANQGVTEMISIRSFLRYSIVLNRVVLLAEITRKFFFERLKAVNHLRTLLKSSLKRMMSYQTTISSQHKCVLCFFWANCKTNLTNYIQNFIPKTNSIVTQPPKMIQVNQKREKRIPIASRAHHEVS